jgi:arsenite/tail-anchored protein-transporting ATPase
MARILFFIGKGGVGKSTNASLFAYHLAKAGRSVLLDSLDPAHNLHDVFDLQIGPKPKKLAENLFVQETELDVWVKKYLKQTEADFKEIYKYQEAFNLHKYFKTLKYSPGLEEYAVLLALEDTVSRHADKDFIIFDTPPTALTLKFFALPDVSLIWLRELSVFREKILSKKDIVTKIREGKSKGFKETDMVLRKIGDLTSRYSGLASLMKDPVTTTIFTVLNPTVLSLEESKDIQEELVRLGFRIPYFILNKCGPTDEPFLRRVEESFPGSEVLAQVSCADEVRGIESLEEQDPPLDLDRLFE